MGKFCWQVCNIVADQNDIKGAEDTSQKEALNKPQMDGILNDSHRITFLSQHYTTDTYTSTTSHFSLSLSNHYRP
jgi:hypothetical protein